MAGTIDIVTDKFLSTQDSSVNDKLRQYPQLMKLQVAALSTDAAGDPVAQMTHPQDDPANPRPFWPIRGGASVGDWLWVLLIEGNGIILGDLGDIAASGDSTGAFSAYSSTNITGVVDSTNTFLTLNTEELDVSDWYDPATGRYTPQIEGYYLIGGEVRYSAPSTGNHSITMGIARNGTIIRWGDRSTISYVSAAAVNGHFLVYANGTTDYFQLVTWHDFGVGVTATIIGTAPFTRFEGFLLGSVGGGAGGGISGIGVQDDGVLEGASVATLNFGTGLDVSVAGTVAEITAPGGGGGLSNPVGYIDYTSTSSVPATPAADTMRLYALELSGNFPVPEVKNEDGTRWRLHRDRWQPCYNASGATLNAGTIVTCLGNTANGLEVIPAQADASGAAMPAFGVAMQSIAAAGRGWVMMAGYVSGISGVNTSGMGNGDTIWLSSTVAGGITNAPPSGAGEFIQPIGFVTTVGNPGAIYLSGNMHFNTVGSGGGITQADADTRYVNVSGDTMTGELKTPQRVRMDTEGSYSSSGWWDQSRLVVRQKKLTPPPEGFGQGNVFALAEATGAVSFGERYSGFVSHMRHSTGVIELDVTGATNASPIVITTSAAHGFSDGNRVGIWDVGGNTNANGRWYVDVLSTTTFALYSDAALTTPVAGNAAYTSGGKVTNKPIMYAFDAQIYPTIDRTPMTGTVLNGDDINCYVAHNGGTGKATDCFYIGRNATNFPGTNPEFVTGYMTDANTDYAFRAATGTSINGLKLDEATFTGLAIKIGQGDRIGSRNAGNSADIDLVRLSATDKWVLSEGGQDIGVWHASPSPSSGGGRVVHLLSTSASVPAELRIENSANQGLSEINLNGKSSGGTVVTTRLYASEFQAWFGSRTNHPFIMGCNNVDRLIFDTGGGMRLRNAANSADLVAINNSAQITLADAANLVVGSTTGTRIGTATTQKLGFWNAAPIVQPANTTDLKDVLETTGLMASGGAAPLNLDGGRLTAGAVTQSVRAVQTVASSGTISRATTESVLPISHGAAITGVIMPAGVTDGDIVWLINRSASTITFAAEATSLVVGGTAAIIPANRAWILIWDASYGGAGVGRWVRAASLT